MVPDLTASSCTHHPHAERALRLAVAVVDRLVSEPIASGVGPPVSYSGGHGIELGPESCLVWYRALVLGHDRHASDIIEVRHEPLERYRRENTEHVGAVFARGAFEEQEGPGLWRAVVFKDGGWLGDLGTFALRFGAA
ncbi:hypothetical protein [Rubricoccus marinus]|uniref:Uncharacterized protein n=1 Tax=Rubricoccus marinus TaxID=716817 RepID=A0A259U1U7_9BACT|nr:hypothetical protein [Rubricoccus marinus]OZC04023.1 hypothetical protein BSZ36_14145 [Rubricoccus marinus]